MVIEAKFSLHWGRQAPRVPGVKVAELHKPAVGCELSIVFVPLADVREHASVGILGLQVLIHLSILVQKYSS